jgi:hypothetical protein
LILKKAAANKMIDIVEVRTKDIGLTQVTTETDIRIVNSFLLPITIVSIQTDLLNREGLKIGKMIYEQPRKIKSKSDEVLTTLSQISIITSLFQAISTLLMQDINMRSVGFARVKILWWYIDIPVDDTFIIHPKKVKIIKELTEEELKAREEERLVRAQAKEFRTVLKKQDRDLREIENAKRRSKRKEAILKRRYKDNYIPKEERRKNAAELIDHEAVEETNFTVELNENVIQQMADDTTTTTTEQPENTDVLQQDDVTTEIQKPTTDSDNT